MQNSLPINLLAWQRIHRQRQNHRTLIIAAWLLMSYLLALSLSYSICRTRSYHWQQLAFQQQRQLTPLMPSLIRYQQLTEDLLQSRRQRQHFNQIKQWHQDLMCRLQTAAAALTDDITWQSISLNQHQIKVTAEASNEATLSVWLAEWTRLGQLSVNRQKSLPSTARAEALNVEIELSHF